MKKLVQEKAKAVALRKQGFSYNEILQEVPVAKSSLSLWLKDLPLTSAEKAVLKQRKDKNISRGRIKAAAVHRSNRLEREKLWLKQAKEQFNHSKHDPLFHTGVSLYWAEGGKRTDQFQFSNSDSDMVNVMLAWIETYCKVDRVNLRYRLYLHKPYAHEGCSEWWAEQMGIPPELCPRVTFKPTQLGVKKRPNYKGCMRIEVPKSKDLLCKMKFWINMLVDYYQ